MEYPVAPTVLGIILGDLLDKNLRRALVLTEGDLIPFFTRPISLILIFLVILTLAGRTKWFKRSMSVATGKIGRMFGKRSY
jgi:putative tricarboxylic transport membrane protein